MNRIGYWYQCHCQLYFVQPSWHADIQEIQKSEKHLECKKCESPLIFIEHGQAEEYGEYYLEER